MTVTGKFLMPFTYRHQIYIIEFISSEKDFHDLNTAGILTLLRRILLCRRPISNNCKLQATSDLIII